MSTPPFAWEHGDIEWHELPGMLSVLPVEKFKFSYHTADVYPHGALL